MDGLSYQDVEYRKENGLSNNVEVKNTRSVKDIIKSNRMMEIPVFQTKEQFENIINKKVPADTIILDLNSESGRAAVAKKYEPLIHKICHQWVGKINLPYDDLLGFAYEGLTYAMNNYGKKNKKSTATDEAVLSYTFGQFAAYCILNQIKGNGVYATQERTSRKGT